MNLRQPVFSDSLLPKTKIYWLQDSAIRSINKIRDIYVWKSDTILKTYYVSHKTCFFLMPFKIKTKQIIFKISFKVREYILFLTKSFVQVLQPWSRRLINCGWWAVVLTILSNFLIFMTFYYLRNNYYEYYLFFCWFNIHCFC